ncbi:MAG: efflux RND transporter permease subunit [Cyclobacteriaceae bacterium]|nr:efflux RND transporter permease subunit [Cyclobacteriaceae bacterium]
MWIVRLALRRPYTIGVLAFFILIMGVLSIRRMLVDIFPVIDIPVVAMVWSYPGLSADEVEKRVTLISERGISTTVNRVERIESQSYPGIAYLKVYFQQGTDIGAAIAQMTAVSNTSVRNMPPGMQPPGILQFNASNLPVAQLTLSSKTLTEDRMYDYGLNFIRLRLFTIPGLSTPWPYGGKTRMIIVDVDPVALGAKGLSPSDVLAAIQASNVIIPAGTARIGGTEYNVALNSSAETIEQFGDIPVKIVNGIPVRLGDVAKVSDSFADQTNIVRVNRNRATYLTILKKSNASTLAVVEAARDIIPSIKEVAPEGLDMQVDFDQSVFVKNSIESVLHEGVAASVLVSLMILFFLGSWRSVIIVCTSIPLAILVSIIGLNLTGNSINIMTLGGLSLAIGMLVDDATVTVENIHRNRLLGKPLTVAILDGAREISVPALMATLAICIVFFPVILLTGPSRFLFTPMALSVVLAMLASYVLSRTLVVTLSRMFMEHEHLHHDTLAPGHTKPKFSQRFNAWRDKGFDRFRESYGRLLHSMLINKRFTLTVAILILVFSSGLLFVVGTDFFPSTDTGLMKLHFRAPSGTRIEETEKLVDQAEDRIQQIIPADELQAINDMIGQPSSVNTAFVSTDNSSGMDADILISLKEGHKPTREYMQKIRDDFSVNFPGCVVYFQSADIVTQVLNFGLSSPINIQVQFPNYVVAYQYARKLRDEVMKIPGTQDVNIRQVLDYPTLKLNVDRVRAAQLGLTQRDVANDMLISLSSSSLVSPSFFINPSNNVNYPVAVKVPMAKLNSVERLMASPINSANTPITRNSPRGLLDVPMSQTQSLGNISTLSTESRFNIISHYTVARVIDINCNVDGRDLGSVSSEIQAKIDELKDLPAGMKISVRGQSQEMNNSFRTLGLGMVLAIALVYLLMVVLFQSWLDPFIIMIAVPGAFVGILWMLAITGTTINVVSLMGSIVAIGIAVSNSILLVSFANEIRLNSSISAFDAALEAGKTRLRPVLMTAIAMVLGMIPMAIGSGTGGEQNAPLGRAVIGGLLVATVVTLFVVPVVYSILRTQEPPIHTLDLKFDEESKGAEQ